MHHVISETESIRARLLARFETCTEGILASAFFTRGAFLELREGVGDALMRGAKLTFLLGRYDYVTDPKAVTALLRLGQFPGARLRVLFDHDFSFHYKVALFSDQAKHVAILGSSNLTPKGLSSRGEDNVEIVGEYGLCERLRKDLRKRIETALDAEKSLPEYSLLYRKYRRLRVAIDRANSTGARKSEKERHWRRRATRLDLSSMDRLVYCGMGGFIEDSKIIGGANREIKRAEKSGVSLPNQWVRVPRAEYPLYKEGGLFLASDDNQRTIGIATCIRTAEVLDSNATRVYLVLYRYARGWKCQFPTENSYVRHLKALRVGNRVVLGRAAVRAVEKLLVTSRRR
jgi:PLD-like domain